MYLSRASRPGSSKAPAYGRGVQAEAGLAYRKRRVDSDAGPSREGELARLSA
jgi:hypothetical protein